MTDEKKHGYAKIILQGWSANSTLRSEGKALIAMTPSDAREKLSHYQDKKEWILVCPSIDWSWSDIVNEVSGVVTDHGTRVSRGSEVSGIVQVAAVLGTKNATEVIHAGDYIKIKCEGNQAIAKVY